MERMSEKLKDICLEFYLSTEERCFVTAAIDRLAAYEDTGLTPEKVMDLKFRMEGLEK